jgi:hypothetical protein
MRYMTFFSLGRKNTLPYSPSMCWLYGHELRYFSILRTIENQACYIVVWMLWNARNNVVIKGCILDKDGVVFSIKSLS